MKEKKKRREVSELAKEGRVKRVVGMGGVVGRHVCLKKKSDLTIFFFFLID